MRISSYAVVLCAFLATTAAAQTKGSAAPSPKSPAASTARSVAAINCVDRNTAAPCKSFKELVDAGDSQILRDIFGVPAHARGHISYVCLRPGSDAFSVVEFDVPESKDFKKPETLDEDIARYADDSVAGNRELRESLQQVKGMIEKMEFGDFSDPPAVSQYTKDQWFQDHGKDFLYAPGLVYDFRFQNGQDMGSVSDVGEWSMLAASKESKQLDPPIWFTGGYAWIERFKRRHGDASARDDDPEYGHISVYPSSIQIHYRSENPSGDTADYALQIHRLTGRFVESFKFPYSNDEDSGTCMIFR